jgi:hypothetical protein
MNALQRGAVFAAVAAVLSGPAWPASPKLAGQGASKGGPDTYASRVQAFALVQTLNADILASSSATASLEKWCRDRRLADEPTIIALVIKGMDNAPTSDQLQRLRVSDAGQVKHRRVQLRCGASLLSEADNWYVPSRLTAEMNRLLETTSTPFGRVVQPLAPYRTTFVFNMLWSAEDVAIPDALFEHRAILSTREHEPFSDSRLPPALTTERKRGLSPFYC